MSYSYFSLKILIINIVYITLCFSNLCTDECDKAFPTGNSITICGSDLLTHYTTFDALCPTNSCYMLNCSVMTYYPGKCGCPNDCFSEYNQGTCSSDNTCKCNTGWTGKDCSLVSYGNVCSLHGKLVSVGNKDSVFPFDYCDCDDGFTGIDCSSPVLKDAFVPWGNVWDTPAKEYTKEDKYGDDHPVWNTSLISTIRIEIDEELFLGLLNPINSLNQSYTEATIHFDNGYVQETYSNVGFKQKGSGCRKHQKHCWNVKFDSFVTGQAFKGMKKLGIKGGTNHDDVLAKYMMYVDFLRAAVVPVGRTSLSLLYINDVYMGLNLIHEDIDPDFITRRIDGDDGLGNLMKFDGGVYLQYFGDNVETYQNNTEISQANGDGDWSDWVDWLKFLNNSSDKDFEDQLEGRVDVESLLRLMIVESFLMDTDGMARNGRNYNTYNLRNGVHPDTWQLFNYDFDMFLQFDITTKKPYMGEKYLNIFSYFERNITDVDYNPLVNRLLSITKYKNQYIDKYKEYLAALFGSKSPMQPGTLQGYRTQFVYPWVDKDKLWQLSNGINTSQWLAYAEYTVDLLNQRYYNITMQLNY